MTRSLRQFTESVCAGLKPKLISETVVEVTGLLSYVIKLEDGATVRRQKEQLLIRILTHWCLELSWVVMRPLNLPSRPLKRTLS